VTNDIRSIRTQISLIIGISAKLGRPWPVSGAMSFDKDVVLLLLFTCCS